MLENHRCYWPRYVSEDLSIRDIRNVAALQRKRQTYPRITIPATEMIRSRDFIRSYGDDAYKAPAFKPLKEEYDFLDAQKASLDATYQAEKRKFNELASAKKNINRYLAQDKSKVREKAKDELD